MRVSPSALNLQYDPHTQSLTFAIDSSKQFQQTLPLSFGANLSPLVFDGSANANVTATAALNGTLGINLGNLNGAHRDQRGSQQRAAQWRRPLLIGG